MSGTVINWTRGKTESLREAYDAALRNRQEEFTWVETEGTGFFRKTVREHPMLVSYAKYLLEYLEGEFKKPDQPRQPYREGEEGQ